MKKELLTVRNIDEEIWRKFKAKTAEQKLRTGDALTEAMEVWIEEKENKKARPDPRNFSKLAGFIKTKKKVRWSEEIDKTLYGGKK
jgi:hypothetical protein